MKKKARVGSDLFAAVWFIISSSIYSSRKRMCASGASGSLPFSDTDEGSQLSRAASTWQRQRHSLSQQQQQQHFVLDATQRTVLQLTDVLERAQAAKNGMTKPSVEEEAFSAFAQQRLRVLQHNATTQSACALPQPPVPHPYCMDRQQQRKFIQDLERQLVRECVNDKCAVRGNGYEIRWRKSKVVPGADICQSCYRAEALVLADKTCVTCSSIKTNGCWYRSKKIAGGTLCRKCYNKELTSLQNKECGACGSKETKVSWYKSHVTEGVFLCHRCYYKERAAISMKSCVACGTDKTSGSWLRSKTFKGKFLCMNCYYKELVALSKKMCHLCESETTSSIWYRSKTEKGKHICAKCYSRTRKEKVKEAKEAKGMADASRR